MGLRDIGGGFQIADLTKLKGAESSNPLKENLSLIDMVNRIQNAPLDRRIKEIDLALKGNQLLNTEVDNEKKRADLAFTYSEEARKQSKFFADQLTALPDAYKQSFELGKTLTERSIPGSIAIQNEDKTVTVSLPNQDGVTETFTLDPSRVADPEKRISIQDGWRDKFVAGAKDFGIQSQFFRNMKGLSKLATAQADIGIVFSYMKLLDPGSTVREGEQATARNSPGVPERIRNMYNRALTDDAPLFGDTESPTRGKFIDAAQVLYDNAKQDVLNSGKFYVNMAEKGGLDPESVVAPVGGLTYKDFLDSQESQAPSENPEPQGAEIPSQSPDTTAPKRELNIFKDIGSRLRGQ